MKGEQRTEVVVAVPLWQLLEYDPAFLKNLVEGAARTG